MSEKHSDYSLGGKHDDGFTLVELMITLVIASIITIGAFSAYSLQSKTFSTQRQVSKMQQDMRGALYLMEYDLLNACRDPGMTNLYGFRDVRYYDYQTGSLETDLGPTPFVMPPAGGGIYYASFPVLEFASLRRDTDVPPDGIGDSPTTIRYQVFDFNNDGRLDLGRRELLGPLGAPLPNPDLVAEGVIAVGYAFAYNLNPNGKYEITRTPPPPGFTLGNVIWAVDTNGDNQLDTNIDINGDGQITVADDISGDGFINSGDNINALLPTPLRINSLAVVAIRIWILLESDRQSPENIIDTNRYVVADRIIPPNPNGFQDRFKRRLKTVTIGLRNYRKN